MTVTAVDNPIPHSFNPRVPCGTRFAHFVEPGMCLGVSIRASRVGRDNKLSLPVVGINEFQSARPVWDAMFGC